MITIYSKPNCMQCEFTKKFLKKNNIDFAEVNIDENFEDLEKVKNAGYMQLPVVVVGNFDNSWSGFRPDRLEELLKK